MKSKAFVLTSAFICRKSADEQNKKSYSIPIDFKNG